MCWRALIEEIISGICRLEILGPGSFSESSTRCGYMLSWGGRVLGLGILLMLDRLKVVETCKVPLRVIVIFLVWVRLPVRLAWFLCPHPSFQFYLPIQPPLFMCAHYGISSSWARYSNSVLLFLYIVSIILIHQLVLIDFGSIVEITIDMARGTLVVQCLEIRGLMASPAVLSSVVQKLRKILRVVSHRIAAVIRIRECMLIQDGDAVRVKVLGDMGMESVIIAPGSIYNIYSACPVWNDVPQGETIILCMRVVSTCPVALNVLHRQCWCWRYQTRLLCDTLNVSWAHFRDLPWLGPRLIILVLHWKY